MEDEAAEQPLPNVDTEVAETSDGSYAWPLVHYDVPPYRTYHFFQQFRNSPSPSNANNFLKGVKWSPDGSCFLTCADDNTLHVFTLPQDDNGNPLNTSASDTDEDSYAANIVITEGESVYDYCWYPHMTASNPDSCVYATTTRDHPIHLWDANSGQLRCTYRAYDAMDEITAAFSIGFNPAGTKIYAGYNKTIRIFEVHRPGRDFDQHATVSETKKDCQALYLQLPFLLLILEC